MSKGNFDQKKESRGKIYISVVLEKPDQESFTDTLTDVIIRNVMFDPLPLQANKMFVAMTSNNYVPKTVEFITVDLKNPRSMS